MRLHPRNNDAAIYGLLRASAEHLADACDLVAQIVAADRPRREELREELHAAEHAADESHHELQRLINATFVTPLDREDLLLIASHLDDCVDLVDEVGDCIVLYQVGALPPACTRLVEILRRCAELTTQAMGGLRSLRHLREYWVEVNSLENEADQLYRATIAQLFAEETDPIRLIKVKEVVERLESSTDAFENLANAVEAVALREG